MDVHARRRFDSGGPALAEVGETELLSRLVAIAGGVAGHPPAGDDAAVWRPPPGRDVVVSQDCLVEGVDFRREWIRPHQLGRRALAAALSDLAGMGARPAYCLATLCAPASTRLEDVVALQHGLRAAADGAGCPLIGGDVSDIQGPLVIDISVAGTVVPEAVLRRDAGAPGDALVVTGVLGGAAAGLALLADPGLAGLAGAAADGWVKAQLEPEARLAEGEALAGMGVRCGGDLSDGLIEDLRRTAAASRCGAELWLDTLPIDGALRTVFPTTWMDHALGGGEDFELVAAAAPGLIAAIRRAWPPRLRPLTVVGRLVAGSGIRLREREGGPARPLPASRSRHYHRSDSVRR